MPRHMNVKIEYWIWLNIEDWIFIFLGYSLDLRYWFFDIGSVIDFDFYRYLKSILFQALLVNVSLLGEFIYYFSSYVSYFGFHLKRHISHNMTSNETYKTHTFVRDMLERAVSTTVENEEILRFSKRNKKRPNKQRI